MQRVVPCVAVEHCEIPLEVLGRGVLYGVINKLEVGPNGTVTGLRGWIMPYGADVRRLDEVVVGDVKIAAYPDVMRMLDLKPGQTVDDETANKIVAENERYYLAKT